MTFRAKPVVKRDKPSWQRGDRRNFYTNLGFTLVVVAAILILVIAGIATWYNEHLAPVASVNGQTITKDDYVRRFAAESARFQIAVRRLDDEFNAGRLTQAQLDSQKQLINQRAQQLQQIVYERLIDQRIMDALAAQEGVTISDAEIDAQIDKEATLPEQRRAWVIEVEPEVADDAEEPTTEQKNAAKAKADQALADINGGKSWDEVAKAVSTGSSKALAGDLGYIGKEDSTYDAAWLEAVFNLPTGQLTGVIVGEDGVYRIGRVTDIVPERVIEAYRDEIVAEGVDLAFYRSVVRADLISEKLNETITARATAPGPQREVKELFIQAGEDEPPTGSIKTRHILYAPKDDPDGASELPQTDPAWATAEQDARAAHAKIKADPDLFDEIAREESDEPGADASGGKLPYFDPTMTIANGGQLDDAFGAAIFKDELQAGDLLDPVKSSFGWHVIQVMYRPPDIDQANKLKTEIAGGADFAELARNFSDAESAADGGELGWVARYQLSKEREDAIFAATVGQVTDPIEVEGEGIYLYLVTKEEMRTPEGEQKETIEAEAFSNWYAQRKLEFDVSRDINFQATGA